MSRRTWLACAGAVAGVGLVPGTTYAGDEPVQSFLGKYKFAGGDRERKARDQAIDDVVAGMSILARGIARDRLQESTAISEKLALSADARSLTIAGDARSYTGPLNGTPVKVKGVNGDELDMHFDIKKEFVRQVFRADGRGRVNVYRLDEAKLTMNVRVHSSKLPKDLVFKLTYQRA